MEALARDMSQVYRQWEISMRDDASKSIECSLQRVDRQGERIRGSRDAVRSVVAILHVVNVSLRLANVERFFVVSQSSPVRRYANNAHAQYKERSCR